MEDITLIANSGIQLFTFPLEIDTNEKFIEHFREWFDSETQDYRMELLHKFSSEDGEAVYYTEKDLAKEGFLSNTRYSLHDVKEAGIPALPNTEPGIYKISFTDSKCLLPLYENQWIPVPYFYRRSTCSFDFGAFNWARCKLVPQQSDVEGKKFYNVILAIDTRVDYDKRDTYSESPIFPDAFKTDLDFEVCSDKVLLRDFCAPNSERSAYIAQYLKELTNPMQNTIGKIRKTGLQTDHISSYFLLINYIAQKKLFPKLTLYKNKGVVEEGVDMIVDIGNSKTTVILKEGHNDVNWSKLRQFELRDMTNFIVEGVQPEMLNHEGSFDMRLAFRKADFGNFKLGGSRQFVYPSLIRLGIEANTLIHKSKCSQADDDRLSTYSSPKRYLWDAKPSHNEWRFLTLDKEKESHILNIEGLTKYINSDGTVNKDGNGGITFNYSRRSLMTFAFLEMLNQALAQINSHEYRKDLGHMQRPRQLERLIVTCPTTMSEIERKALVKCANDAITLFELFYGSMHHIEVAPNYAREEGDENIWYFDEASCSQLVYMFAEIGHKYKGKSDEFFNLYGKKNENHYELTVGSLDIGAGTTDLMICKYTYEESNKTTLVPEPLFYDSFYMAGDDMLKNMVYDFIAADDNTVIRNLKRDMPYDDFHQLVKDFFGGDHTGMTMEQRRNRRDFNIQVSVPLMNHFLQLLANNSPDCIVKYSDVFDENPPAEHLLTYFQNHFGLDFCKIDWQYDAKRAEKIVVDAFDPLLQKIAAIMYAHSCDLIVLSGRPASLSPIRQLFLNYYAVAPYRLITLNDYYVGEWYPFSNTGFIKNPKSVVAVGALLGFYSSNINTFEDFTLDTRLLSQKLKSTMNFISSPHTKDKTPNYCLTDNKHHGEVLINTIPTYLNVRQVDFPSYPSRPLFVIDIDIAAMEKTLLRQNPYANEQDIQEFIQNKKDAIKQKLPFAITLDREPDNRETLTLTDNEGNEGTLRISVQSMKVSEGYWLDTGIFEY